MSKVEKALSNLQVQRVKLWMAEHAPMIPSAGHVMDICGVEQDQAKVILKKVLDEMPEYKALKEETQQLRAKAGTKFGNILRKTIFLPIP